MRTFSQFSKKWRDEIERRQIMDTLQLCFVAAVWFALFALVLAVQGCADKSKDLQPSKSEKDLEIKETTTLSSSEYLILNRLVFARGGRLLTQGADLRIEANEIVSDEGVVEAFDATNVAPNGTIGLSGGNISIRAKSGRGTLYIYGRGQNGGIGVQGLTGVAGKLGEEGKYALGTHEKADVVCHCGEIARQLREEIRTGNFLLQLMAQQQWFGYQMMHRCISEAGNGQPGEQGGAGSNGGNGGRGGDSARIYVELKDASALLIKAYPVPGQGGTGGSGGQGGDGGRGGAPGDHNLDYFGNCRDASAGPKGASGDRGQPGGNGLSGDTLPQCVKLGNTEFGDCDKFKSEKGGNQ